ncbi:MAG: transcriptional regulator [Desulfuromonadaceae bacterium]
MAKEGSKKEPIPAQRGETIRQGMLALLQQQSLTVRELSTQLRSSEREVYPHLQHLRLSLQRSGFALKILPAVCQDCGFLFSKRDRLKKPGRCPVCRSELIQPPQNQID